MAQPFVGEIRCFGFNFAPYGWAFCNGALLPISDYSTLYNLIGTTYGGDGVNTFALPNLQSRVPMHWGTGGGMTTVIAQTQGVETVTLTTSQIPAHTHTITAASVNSGGVVDRTQSPGAQSFLAASAPDALWNKSPTIDSQFASNAIGAVGGSQPHTNIQPYLALNFSISLFGIYPSQN